MTNNVLDKVGIWASSLCGLHCLMLPVLLPAIPLMGATFFAQHWFERLVLIMSMVIGFTALMSGFYRYHRQIYPFYSLALGGFLYWHKDMFGETWEPATVVTGAILIIVAHVLNIKLCKSCQDCSESESA